MNFKSEEKHHWNKYHKDHGIQAMNKYQSYTY